MRIPAQIRMYSFIGSILLKLAARGEEDVSALDIMWWWRDADSDERNQERADDYQNRLKAYRLAVLLAEAKKRIGPFK